MIEKARNRLLAAALILLSIPGFIGQDLSMAGARLGRFQPFKFVFIAWLFLQWVCVARQLRRSGLGPVKPLPWLALLVMDLLLGLALIVEGNPGRGSSILLSLVLGQVAALACVLDREFPFRWMLRGLQGAALALILFSLAEVLFPTAPFTVAFLKLVRDDAHISYQLGSSLTTVALAELCVRALPLVLPFSGLSSRMSLASALASAALVLMLLFTLEKSGLLALGAIGVAAVGAGILRASWKPALGFAGGAVLLMLLVLGPEKIVGRYFGSWLTGQETAYSQSSHRAMKERLYVLELGSKVLVAKPWLGIGLDGFAYRSQKKLPPLEEAYRPEGSHTHNLLLETAVSGGIAAMLALLLAYGSTAVLAWKGRPRRWPVLLYLAGQGVSMVTDARIYVSWLAITLFWFAGMAWTAASYDHSAGEYGKSRV